MTDRIAPIADQRAKPLRVREQVNKGQVPPGSTGVGVAEVVLKLFGEELLARCQERGRDRGVSGG